METFSGFIERNRHRTAITPRWLNTFPHMQNSKTNLISFDITR